MLQRPPEFSDLEETQVSSAAATDPGPAEEIERDNNYDVSHEQRV